MADPQQLFISRKNAAGRDNSEITTCLRQIEWFVNHQPAAVSGIQEITSVDHSVTIVNPFGPIVDLHVATGGGGGYASLTGPGQTVTPGDLTQAGGFTVNDPGTTGFHASVPQFITSSTGTTSISAGTDIQLRPDSAGSPNQIVFTSYNVNTGAGTLDMTANTQSVVGGNWPTVLWQVDGFEVLAPAPSSTNVSGGIAFGDFYPAGNGGIGFQTLSSVTINMGQTFRAQATGATFHTIQINDDSVIPGGIMIAGNAAQKIGFYGNTPRTQITVTGSRAGNAALASLLIALNALGLIVDSST